MPEVDPPDGPSALDVRSRPRAEPPAFTGRLTMQHRFG